jgi:hypothetical protein
VARCPFTQKCLTVEFLVTFVGKGAVKAPLIDGCAFHPCSVHHAPRWRGGGVQTPPETKLSKLELARFYFEKRRQRAACHWIACMAALQAEQRRGTQWHPRAHTPA